MREQASFHMFFFEKNDPKVPSKIKVSSHYEEGKANVEFVSKVQQCYQDFYQATLIRFSTVFVIDFSRKTALKLFR